jgi:phosphopantetheinyl transferase (holo-ACP synthase)
LSSVYVGNDIVDLARPRTHGRSADERFVARILGADEQQTVHSSAEPDVELWCHWAAKEAGYKVISKLVGTPPPFVHRAFEVAWSEVVPAAAGHPSESHVIRRGTVRWREHGARVSVALHAHGVHAVAHAAPKATEERVCVRSRVARLDAPEGAWAGTLEELLPLFSRREADAVYSRASAAVRVAARGELAALLDVPEPRLEIVCAPGRASQRPPRVLLDGRETEADVSLSHDGPLIAWALWVGSGPAPASRDTTGFDTEGST